MFPFFCTFIMCMIETWNTCFTPSTITLSNNLKPKKYFSENDCFLPGSLDQVIKFPQGRISGQRLEIGEQILFFCLEQLPIDVEPERLVPEGSDVDPSDLWGCQHLAQWPHESAVHTHQLLMVDSVGFVENNPEILYIDLVLSLHTINVIKTSDFMGSMATPPWGSPILKC